MGNQRLNPLKRILKLLAITIPVTIVAIQLLGSALMARAVTIPLKNQICCETPEDFGAKYLNMQFLTQDGLKLSGWYLPPHNGAVIILVHSYYSDRRQTLPVAEMLYTHGYGLLMYDQRASGESEGDLRSLGALDIPDLGRAADWLLTQQKDLRIGAYGCSMGGAISLAGALKTNSIRALAIDAPSPMSWFKNLPAFSLRDPFGLPTMALYYTFVKLRTGAPEPAGTLENTRHYIDRPILFISTGQGAEFSGVNSYYQAASEPKSHWNIPDSTHCAAQITHPLEYEQHLINFFDHSLHK